MKYDNILIKVAVGLESINQNLHFLHFPEGQVRDDAQQALQDAEVGTDKSAVNLIEQHYQLIFVTGEKEVTLQRKKSLIYVQE